MNTENVAKWVAALRSGVYEQGKDHLAKDSKFCCLGVACEVAIQDGLEVETKVNMYGCGLYDGSVATVPDSVATWLGLPPGADNVWVSAHNTNADVVDNHPSGRVSATALNDRYGLSFNEIADALEKEYLS